MFKKILLWLSGLLIISVFAAGEPAPQVEVIPVTMDVGSAYEISKTDGAKGVSKTDFSKTEPAVTFSKWNGESTLKITYTGLTASSTKAADGTIKYVSGSQELHAYPLQEKAGMEDGGTEIEVVLNSAPSSNVFTFQLQNYEDLDFKYQAPLNLANDPSWPEAFSCTATDCFDKNGKATLHRDDNVVGSYAVYHKTKKDYRVGAVNYEAGKALHIYRPQAVDNNGQKVWCDLNISVPFLTVTCPQSFLDTAAYPVKVDPTFGKTAHGASTNTFQADYIEASHYTLSDSGAVVTKITAYVDNNGAGASAVKGVIYNQSASKPLTLQANSAGVTLAAGAAAAEIDYTLSVTLSAAEYWLGLDNQTANGRFYYDDGAANSSYFFTAAGTYTTPPATWSDFGNARTRLQTNYATYTTSGAGPSKVSCAGGQCSVGGDGSVIIK